MPRSTTLRSAHCREELPFAGRRRHSTGRLARNCRRRAGSELMRDNTVQAAHSERLLISMSGSGYLAGGRGQRIQRAGASSSPWRTRCWRAGSVSPHARRHIQPVGDSKSQCEAPAINSSRQSAGSTVLQGAAKASALQRKSKVQGGSGVRAARHRPAAGWRPVTSSRAVPSGIGGRTGRPRCTTNAQPLT